jgi:hypothetical protein
MFYQNNSSSKNLRNFIKYNLILYIGAIFTWSANIKKINSKKKKDGIS